MAVQEAFLERLLYPSKSLRPIRSAFIYTMNAPEDIMKELKMNIVLGAAEQFVSRNFMSEPDVVYAFDAMPELKNNYNETTGHKMMMARREDATAVIIPMKGEGGKIDC